MYVTDVIRPTNSLDFVRTIFSKYKEGKIVTLCRASIENELGSDFKIQEIITPEKIYGWMDGENKLPKNDSLAHVIFTSGTEGAPKGVGIKHLALSDVSSRLISTMEMTSDIREYIGVPVSYSFGLGRCRAISDVGGKFFLPRNGFDPYEISHMSEKGEINSISAVPSLWRVVLANPGVLSSRAKANIRWIEIGSQYMSTQEKRAMNAIFPNAKIVQHYGLTEASRSTLLRLDLVPSEYLDSVGFLTESPSIRISSTGRIMIKGNNLAEFYVQSSLVRSTVDEDGWLLTGDNGEIRNNYLYYNGRADDMINCGGVKINPEIFERELREKIADNIQFGVTGFKEPILGSGIAIAVENGESEENFQRLSELASHTARDLNIYSRQALKLLRVNEIPKTETGKIRRKELSEMVETEGFHASEGLTSSIREVANYTETEQRISQIWKSKLGLETIDRDMNFYTASGDSLAALTLIIDLERENIDQRIISGIVQGKTIREIASEIEGGRPTQNIPLASQKADSVSGYVYSNNLIRGALVLTVILAHWSGGLFARLPDGISGFEYILAPLLAMGTPGFAVVYGISIALSQYKNYLSGGRRDWITRKRTAKWLALGICILGLTKFIASILTGNQITITEFTNSFYGVLTFYICATLSMPIWFEIIRRSANPTLFSLLLALICYVAHIVISGYMLQLELEGIQEFIKLMIAAKYAYFSMMTGVLMGFSFGCLLNRGEIPYERLYLSGLAITILGMVISYHVGTFADWIQWPVSSNPIWRWIVYTGVIVLLIGVTYKVRLKNIQEKAWTKVAVNLLSITGYLAFPLFVLHELVIPVKTILNFGFGIGSSVALTISLTFFFISTWILYKKMRNFAVR